MRKTPHLGLTYGGLTYDGGLSLITGRNLNRIDTELKRLMGLAGITTSLVLTKGAFVNDGGQERAARENLQNIKFILMAVGSAAASPAPKPLAIDLSLAATDGGRPAVMWGNLLTIDAECKRLSDALDGGGEGGDNWLTGRGKIALTMAEMPNSDPAVFDANTAFADEGLAGVAFGYGVNTRAGDSGLSMLMASTGLVDGVGPAKETILRIAFTNTTLGSTETRLVSRAMTISLNGAVIWQGRVQPLTSMMVLKTPPHALSEGDKLDIDFTDTPSATGGFFDPSKGNWVTGAGRIEAKVVRVDSDAFPGSYYIGHTAQSGATGPDGVAANGMIGAVLMSALVGSHFSEGAGETDHSVIRFATYPEGPGAAALAGRAVTLKKGAATLWSGRLDGTGPGIPPGELGSVGIPGAPMWADGDTITIEIAAP